MAKTPLFSLRMRHWSLAEWSAAKVTESRLDGGSEFGEVRVPCDGALPVGRWHTV